MTILLRQNNKGFSLIEVLIACAVLSTVVLSMMTLSTKGIQLSHRALRQTQANLILEEGAEAVKSIRDDNWTNISGLTLGTTYYVTFSTITNKWSLTTTAPSNIDSIFLRQIVFAAVNRDANDDIAGSGTLDTRTIKVTVTVSWPDPGYTTIQKTLSFYISDIFN